MSGPDDRVECFRAAIVLGRVTASIEERLAEVNGQRLREGGPNGTRERRARTDLSQMARVLSRVAPEAGLRCGVDGDLAAAAADVERAVRYPREFDLGLAMDGANRLHAAIDDPHPATPAGGPPLIVLTNEGYVTVRGPKHDVTLFLRLTDGDIQYEIYPAGRAPPSGTDAEVGDMHARAEEEVGFDGGDLPAATRGDVAGVEQWVFEITGTRVRLATAPPPFGSLEQALGITSVGHGEPSADAAPPFIRAEAEWNALTPNQRRDRLHAIGLDDDEIRYHSMDPLLSYVSLSGELLDIIEGDFARRHGAPR